MIKTVLKRAAIVTADSQEMIEAILRLAPGKKTMLILLGITPIKPLPKEKIVYSNRALFPLYNVEGIIDEFMEFVKENPGWKLQIAGTGPGENYLKEKVQKAGIEKSVEFCGWLGEEQNNANYQKASIYISLPVSDGTSVSLLEAMSAGCIPVLSDLPVSHEWIQDNLNGIIKSDTDNALQRAAKLNQAEVGAYNQNLIELRATKAIASKKFHETYQQL